MDDDQGTGLLQWPNLCSTSQARRCQRDESHQTDPIDMASSVSAVQLPTRPAPAGRVRSFIRRLQSGDEIAHLITLMFASSIFLVTVLLVFELYHNSALPRHKFGWAFFVTQTWDPVFENFGALPFIYG